MLSKFVTSKGGELRCEPTFIFCPPSTSARMPALSPELSDNSYRSARFHGLGPWFSRCGLQTGSISVPWGLVRRAGHQAPPIAPETETLGCSQHPVSAGPPDISSAGQKFKNQGPRYLCNLNP